MPEMMAGGIEANTVVSLAEVTINLWKRSTDIFNITDF